MRQFALHFAMVAELGPPGYDLGLVYDALELETRCNISEKGIAHQSTESCDNVGIFDPDNITVSTNVSNASNIAKTTAEVRREEDYNKTPKAYSRLVDNDNTDRALEPHRRVYITVLPSSCSPSSCSSSCSFTSNTSSTPGLSLREAIASAGRTAKTLPTTILLRQGVHYLGGTGPLVLGPEHSGLEIRSYPGEVATISGGVPLTRLAWSPHATLSPHRQQQHLQRKQRKQKPSAVQIWSVSLARYNLTNGVPGLRLDDGGPRVVRARTPNGNPERTGLHTVPTGWFPATSVQRWLPGRVARGPTTPPIETLVKTPNRSNFSNVYPYYTMGIGGVCNGLFTPNASFWCNPRNPRDGARGVWNGSGGLIYTPGTFSNGSGVNNNGLLDGGGGGQQEVGAIAHVWHDGGHWATQMYRVSRHDASTRALIWGEGGFQDARADPTGAEWYLENSLALLDAPNEFYYAPENQTLYMVANVTPSSSSSSASSSLPVSSTSYKRKRFVKTGNANSNNQPPRLSPTQRPTATPPSPSPRPLSPPSTLIATQSTVLLVFNGTRENPVRGVTLSGLRFVDTAQTFMAPHGVPSGGDWALQASAAVELRRTESITVSNCTFQRLDGNALLLYGYNRNASIVGSDFSYIGDTAMAAWGVTDEISDNGTKGWDATDGDYPRFTLVERCAVREVGLFEKQSSAWFQAKTAATTLRRNIFYNGPRAGINFNDGMGGGSLLEGNLVFNMCRESSDHGPFNSWDRQPFVVRQPDDNGTPDITPRFNTLQGNMIVANYQSQEAVDNDDGSGFYHTRNNFLVYGNIGQKCDMAGHDMHHTNNVYAYLGGACYVDLGGGEASVPHENWHTNNTCVLGINTAAYAAPNCRDNASWPVLANNTIYSPTGNTTVCGETLAERQEKGLDLGSRVLKGPPPDNKLLMWAAEALAIQPFQGLNRQ